MRRLKLIGSSRRGWKAGVVQLFMALALTLSLVPVGASAHSHNQATLHPALLELSRNEPGQNVRVIVLAEGGLDDVEFGVTWAGGTVARRISLINALLVDVPAGRLSALAQIEGVLSIGPDAPVWKSVATGEEGSTLQQDFNGSVSSEPGSVNWNWYELGESDGLDSGNVSLTPFLAGTVEGVRIQGAGYGLQASADLGLAASATLGLSFRRKGFESAGDAILLQVSRDGGEGWSEIGRLTGPNQDGDLQIAHFDMSAYAGEKVLIRLLAAESLGDQARFYIDFIQVSIEQDPRYSAYQVALPALASLGDPSLDRKPSIFAASTASFVRDEFNHTSYANNDGSATWAGNWREHGDNGSPHGGSITVEVDDCPHGSSRCIEFDSDSSVNTFIARAVDLTGVDTALLTFDYRLDLRGTTYLLEASTDNGHSWTGVRKYGAAQTVFNEAVDLSAFTGGEVFIRFRLAQKSWTSRWSHFYIDNVQIDLACGECIDTAHMQSTYVEALRADELWNATPKRQGSDVTVAVVDSGITLHPDLYRADGTSRVLAQVDFTDGTGSMDDSYGHGTHVAGTIAGDGAHSGGMYIGIAPKASLVDVKVTDDYGAGYTSDVVDGLEWVLDNKDLYNIRVVNMSLNSSVAESYHDSPLDAAVEILWLNGIVVVVSSGNNGSSNAGVIYPPANDPFVITVGAVDDMDTADRADDTIAAFTAYGTTTDGFTKPEIFVPGSDIIAPISGDDANLVIEHPAHAVSGPGGTYYFRMSGTSMASAVAAGAVALLLEDEPDLTPDQVKFRLMHSGSPFMGGTYLDLKAAVYGDTLQSANQGTMPHLMLAKMAMMAYWATTHGDANVDWSSVNWNSVNWNSVNWSSVNWSSVNWNSVNWNSVNWNSVNWNSVNWNSVNWNSVSWNSAFTWSSVNWNSVNWNSSFTWSSVHWDD